MRAFCDRLQRRRGRKNKEFIVIIMKKLIWALVPVFLAVGVNAAAQSQQQEPPDYMEIAEKEADRLQEMLDLEDWQTFYVDSTLKHDYIAMTDEIMSLQQAKVQNSSLYVSVQDKWVDTIEASYRKIFNDEQWAAYLKSGAGKAQKMRAKRKAKAEQELGQDK